MKILCRKYFRDISMMVMFIFLISGITGIYGATLPQITIPQPLQLDDVIGYARVKNISNSLDVVDYWISLVNPQMPPGTAKMSAGEFFGDPTMASIDITRPMTFVFLNPKKFPNPLLLYLPAKETEKMQTAIQAKGSFTLVKDNTIIIGDDQAATMKGGEIWNTVKPFSISPLDTDILLFMDMEKTMLLYGEDIKQKIQNLQNQMSMMQNMSQQQQAGMAEQQKQMQAQTEEMIKMMNELKILALKGDIKKEGLLTTLLVQAKPQTDLAKLFVNTQAISPTLIKLLPEGAMKLAFTGNPDALSDFNNRFSDRVLVKSGVTTEQSQEIKKYQELQKQVIDNEMAVSFFLQGKTGINGVFAYKIKDPKLAMELIRQTKQQLLSANNPAQGITVNVDYKEKVRQVEGVDIHSYKMTISSTNPMVMQQMMMIMPGGSMDMEMAIVDKYLATGLGTQIDPVIKTIKQGTGATTLVALSTFPQGGQLYGDVNIIPIVNAILSPMFAMMSMMGGTGQNPMDTLNKISVPPITFYATMHDGKAMGQLDFKLEIVQKIMEGFNTIKQQIAPPSMQ